MEHVFRCIGQDSALQILGLHTVGTNLNPPPDRITEGQALGQDSQLVIAYLLRLDAKEKGADTNGMKLSHFFAQMMAF
jgi:hypothetical protein